jgi:multiple sugar transport system ATP-binding protein
MTTVALQHISKRFGQVAALQDVSFSVQDGEFFVLLGATGAGKTTTLRVVAGLERQDEGSVIFDGEPVDGFIPADRDVAFVFQQYSLYPTMTVYDNLAFPLRSPLRRVPESEIRARVEETAQKLRIGHLIERRTAHLSGGEMQRVAIGRALVRQPRVFLMDEPLSNLDAKLREALRIELQHLQKTEGSTTLFVTHDQIEALTMADHIAVIDRGHVLQIGTPEDIYDRPANISVAQLVGTPKINLVPATYVDGSVHVVDSAVSLPTGPLAERGPESFTLGIRPEDIRVCADGEFAGQIVLKEPLGAETIVHIRTGEQTLQSIVAGLSSLGIGEVVHFNAARGRLHYFAPDGARISPEA